MLGEEPTDDIKDRVSVAYKKVNLVNKGQNFDLFDKTKISINLKLIIKMSTF